MEHTSAITRLQGSRGSGGGHSGEGGDGLELHFECRNGFIRGKSVSDGVLRVKNACVAIDGGDEELGVFKPIYTPILGHGRLPTLTTLWAVEQILTSKYVWKDATIALEALAKTHHNKTKASAFQGRRGLAKRLVVAALITGDFI